MKKKTDKRREFLNSLIRTKEEHDLSDAEMDEFVPGEVDAREKGFKKKLISIVGKELYTEASEWYQSLSPQERSRAKGEGGEIDILISFATKNPSKVSGKDIKRIEKATQLSDERLEPIRAVERDDEGKIRVAPKIKVEKKVPRQPSPKELSKMSVKDIAKLIADTRDALWPSGGGDSEVPGIEGIK